VVAMTAEVRIVGQGLAGSLLGWACECSGISFTIEDPFVCRAAGTPRFVPASSVGAGIINPITGQRLVKSWRIDTLMPQAVAMYEALERALGQRFLYRYRLQRFFADERERNVAREKWARGDFSDFGRSLDENSLSIEPAYRVDLENLVRALRTRWQTSGQWRESASVQGDPGLSTSDALTVRCLGAGELTESEFRWASLVPAKGELLEIETEPPALDPSLIRNCHEWLVPLSESRALIGATFEPGNSSSQPTEEARTALTCAATQLLGSNAFRIVSHRAGVRVVAPDKHPVIGRHPERLSVGIFNALGSKGALLAPWLADQWVAHLKSGQPIDREIDVARFWK